jgi:hypothetical protein
VWVCYGFAAKEGPDDVPKQTISEVRRPDDCCSNTTLAVERKLDRAKKAGRNLAERVRRRRGNMISRLGTYADQFTFTECKKEGRQDRKRTCLHHLQLKS